MAIRIVCAEGAAAYIWRAGDDIDTVARRFNTTAAEIRAINPGVVYTRLQPGELICVPSEDIICPGNRTYRVQEGDSITRIAQRLGVRPGQLLAANPYIDPERLAVGQVICAPAAVDRPEGPPDDRPEVRPTPPDPAPGRCPAGTVSQTVRPGDTVTRILTRNDLSYEYFRELNPNLTDGNLVPGRRYCVPVVRPTGVCETPGARAYVWAVGDTLASVAARYNLTTADILRFNPSLKPSQLVPGQTICLR
jgi:LysM repeat protein